MLESGEKIGRYVIKSLLGSGGMGQVFLAEDAELERLVALKILHLDKGEDEEKNHRFIREAKAASALNHPNILTIYEIGETNGWRFMASEFVKGQTLSTLIKQKNLTLLQTLEIASQVVSALAIAHQNGIVHRDIKPDNLMIRDDNLVKILDFGIAKLIENESLSITKTGAIIGTPQYMSPEQAEGDKLDARTDLFSFGAVFYEMLTGEKAFIAKTLSELFVSILVRESKPVRELNAEIPIEIEEIIAKLLRKNRDERFQTAQEVADLLNSLKKRLELGALDLSVSAEISKTQNNLPENLFPFVGREKQVNEICRLLQAETVRILTLTGIGGTGKTRLSQAVAHELLRGFYDGIFFVELAAVNNPDLVIPTIAQPLGVKESGGKTILESLKDFLREKKVLLVLDNFEQITSAASFIGEISESTPNSKILVTSREVLRLKNEQEYKVPTLNLPTNTDSKSELQNNEAVKLFVERATKIKPNFTLNEENLPEIAEICLRLEGLPLAIEFAAARIRILSPSAILAKLENRLQVLGGGSQDLPTRQQTMRGAIDWSYDLLDSDEKTLFRRLAVFAGGFTFETAENVVGEGLNVLDGITSLLDKSLIFSKENTDGEPRFQMLAVVREYALEVLQAEGETEQIQDNHTRYFFNLAETAEANLRGLQSAAWLNRLEEENDNFRLVIQRLLAKNTEKAVNLIASLRDFWVLRAHLTEGYRWVKTALEQNKFISPKVRFNLLNSLGWLALMQGHYKNSKQIFEEILINSRASNNLEQVWRAARGLTATMAHLGNFSAAQRFCEEGLKVSRELNDRLAIADALNSLGNLTLMQNEASQARPYYEESLMIAREFNNKLAINSNLINLGTVNFYGGNFQKAREYYIEALNLSQELGNKIVIAYCLDGFAALFVNEENFIPAAKISGVADAILNSISAEVELIEGRFRDLYLVKLRAGLGQNLMELAIEDGRKMHLNEAVKLVLES